MPTKDIIKKLIEKAGLLFLHSCGSPRNRVKTRCSGAVAEKTQKEEGTEYKLMLLAFISASWWT